MLADGLRVLSEAYSNPWLIILTSFIFPMVDEVGTIYALEPNWLST